MTKKAFMLFFILITSLLSSPLSLAGETLYSKIKIDPACEASYLQGQDIFKNGLLEKSLGPELYESGLQNIEEKCHFAYSAGIFDAQGIVFQTLMVEWVLEQNDALQRSTFKKASLASLKNLYKKRLEEMAMDSDQLEQFSVGSEVFSSTLKNVLSSFNEQAIKDNKAVEVGRFVFTKLTKNPYTYYDYQLDEENSILYDEKGNPEITEGSYLVSAQNLYDMAYANAKKYIEWRPGVVFGSRTKIFQAKDREAAEEYYWSKVKYYLKLAEDIHLNTENFQVLFQAMDDKRIAQELKDEKGKKLLIYGSVGAVLMPVGIYLGATGLAAAGMSSAMAANVATGLAILPIVTYTGIGIYNVIEYNTESDSPLNLTQSLDSVLLSTISSFPLAAALPAIVGGSAYVGKSFIVNGKALLSQAPQAWSKLKALGLKGSLKAFPKGAVDFVKMYGTKWWQKKWVFTRQLGTELLVMSFFEVGVRQFTLEGEEKFAYKDKEGNWKINKHAIFSLSSGLLVSGFAKPIQLMNNGLVRYMAWRSFSLASGLTIKGISGKETSGDMIFNEIIYGGTVGAASGEVMHKVYKMIENKQMGDKKAMALMFAVGFALKGARMPVKWFLFDRAEEEKWGALSSIRKGFAKHFLLDISDYSDEELMNAIAKVRKMDDEEIAQLLNTSFAWPTNH